MPLPSKKYPAKLLLFGEYTVLHGGDALAVPYPKYFGQWHFLPKGKTVQFALNPFLAHLESCIFPQGTFLDLDAFAKDIESGITFESTIPIGYGAGSSGSLCAGVWDRYGVDNQDLVALRAVFIEMESFFHGKSSGIDPLVSYLNLPILQTQNGIEILDSIALPKQLDVFDSKITRKTAPLVHWYNQEFRNNPAFKEQVLNFLLPQNTKAIQYLLAEDYPQLQTAFQAISEWQWQYFKPLIPQSVGKQWQNAKKNHNAYKICGAGGGGFFLAMEIGN